MVLVERGRSMMFLSASTSLDTGMPGVFFRMGVFNVAMG